MSLSGRGAQLSRRRSMTWQPSWDAPRLRVGASPPARQRRLQRLQLASVDPRPGPPVQESGRAQGEAAGARCGTPSRSGHGGGDVDCEGAGPAGTSSSGSGDSGRLPEEPVRRQLPPQWGPRPPPGARPRTAGVNARPPAVARAAAAMHVTLSIVDEGADADVGPLFVVRAPPSSMTLADLRRSLALLRCAAGPAAAPAAAAARSRSFHFVDRGRRAVAPGEEAAYPACAAAHSDGVLALRAAPEPRRAAAERAAVAECGGAAAAAAAVFGAIVHISAACTERPPREHGGAARPGRGGGGGREPRGSLPRKSSSGGGPSEICGASCDGVRTPYGLLRVAPRGPRPSPLGGGTDEAGVGAPWRGGAAATRRPFGAAATTQPLAPDAAAAGASASDVPVLWPPPRLLVVAQAGSGGGQQAGGGGGGRLLVGARRPGTADARVGARRPRPAAESGAVEQLQPPPPQLLEQQLPRPWSAALSPASVAALLARREREGDEIAVAAAAALDAAVDAALRLRPRGMGTRGGGPAVLAGPLGEAGSADAEADAVDDARPPGGFALADDVALAEAVAPWRGILALREAGNGTAAGGPGGAEH